MPAGRVGPCLKTKGQKMIIDTPYGKKNWDLIKAALDSYESAPELLNALEIMVRAVNVRDIDPLVMFMAIEKAKGAINKARGKK